MHAAGLFLLATASFTAADVVGDGTRKYASQGACYDPTTQITVCFRPGAYDYSFNLTQVERLSQSECEAVGNTWYAKGHIGSDGCCLCDSNCDHSLETAAAGTCYYADANAGSCKNAATGQVTCDVTAGQCASPHVWSAAGALDSDGCCFCDETCDHSAEMGTDCHSKGYADESQSDGSCYDSTTHQLTCDVGHAACDALGRYWYSPGYISSYRGCCHCDASCDHSLETSTDCSSYYYGGDGSQGSGGGHGTEYTLAPTPWPEYNYRGTGNGWCSSDLDEYVGYASTASACWTMCEDRYGSDLVAIDWTPDGECYCQDDCQCMEDTEDSDIQLLTRSDVASLPDVCISACPAEEAAFEDCLSQQNSLDDDCGGGGDYFLATGGQSCDDACASAGGCDLAAITAAASSLETCKSILDDLGISYGMSTGPGTSVDSSGCTYHPGQSGWAQLFGNPTCGTVDPDVSRQRVCACNCGTPGGDGDDDDDDDFSPNTCADVQQWLSDGLCQDGPAVCQTEYQAYVECTYEDAAQSFLGLTCDFACARDCPAGSFDNLETCEDCDALDGDCADCECRDFDQVVEANCKAACLPAPVVTGSISLSGITVEDAEANKAVLQDAIARVAGVETEAVTIQSVALARRRLQASVIVDYKIEADDFAAAEEAAEKLQDTSIIEAEIESSAAAIGKEKVFMNVKIEELSVAVVTTEAPTAAPTTYWDNKRRKDDATLLILIIVCCVAGVCCLLALGTAAAFGAFGSCACFAKKKKMRVAEPSEPPLAHATVMTEAPPALSPRSLAKTQEHIRRTAALMAEAPPSPPGPPPLAPIKATETLPAEMP